MDFLKAVLINGVLVHLNLLLNAFFIYCLVFPSSAQTTKQPLKFLLQTLIFCSVAYLACVIAKAALDCHGANLFTSLVLFTLSQTLLWTSMTTTVWVVVFFRTQLVPASGAASVWVKKNIKSIIFCAWMFERTWFITDASVLCLNLFPLLGNSTARFTTSPQWGKKSKQILVYMWSIMSYLVLSLCLMMASSVSIASYLLRHVRSLSGGRRSCFEPTFRGQLRVTLTGILQGFLYLMCVLWFLNSTCLHMFADGSPDADVHYVVINVYMFATSLNMWLGLSVFRRRTVDVVRALRGTRGGEPGAGRGSSTFN